jgi:Tol biopolymer transport system component
MREKDLVALNPDGKEENKLPNPSESPYKLQGRLSPDGTRAAFVVIARRLDESSDNSWPFKVIIRNMSASEAKVVEAGFTSRRLLLESWSPDGKRLIVTHWIAKGQSKTVSIDAVSGKTEALQLPPGVRVLDWAADGKTFLVDYFKDKTFRLGLLEKGKKEPRELTELKVRDDFNVVARLSPGGKRVLFTDANPEQYGLSQPYIIDVATRKRQPLAEFPDNAEALGVAWSPDASVSPITGGS